MSKPYRLEAKGFRKRVGRRGSVDKEWFVIRVNGKKVVNGSFKELKFPGWICKTSIHPLLDVGYTSSTVIPRKKVSCKS